MKDRLPADRIVLEGMQFYAYHGAVREERSLGQPFMVDLEAELDLSVPGTTDNRDDTVSYTHLYRVVKEVMEGEAKNLLETLAEAIASRALGSFPLLAVKVRVTKTRPPIKGAVITGASVEIYRAKDSSS